MEFWRELWERAAEGCGDFTIGKEYKRSSGGEGKFRK